MKRSDEMTLLGIGLAVLFWLLETTIHTYIFQEDTFVRELFPTYDPNELWMRFVVCAILIIFGIHADVEITRRRKAEEKLKKSEEELRLLSSQLFTIQEDERAHVANQLHDSIGQSLLAIKYGMERFLLEAKNEPQKVNIEQIQELISTIQLTIEEFRKIFMDLRPSTLDELGILATINWYSREIQELHPGLQIDHDIDLSEKDIPVSLRIHIFRVLQEALDNIVKYSQADKALIGLKKKKDTIELVIKDNGIGFDVDAVLSAEKSKRGFGIGSMRERVRLSGGSFSINSSAGKGTEVQAQWSAP